MVIEMFVEGVLEFIVFVLDVGFGNEICFVVFFFIEVIINFIYWLNFVYDWFFCDYVVFDFCKLCVDIVVFIVWNVWVGGIFWFRLWEWWWKWNCYF